MMTSTFYGSHHQKGIGLIEVMVALLLLAVAVMGFTAMQMTAVKATDESLMRTRALTIMRGGAEMMRANPAGINAFKTTINSTGTTDTPDYDAVKKCQKTSCSVNELATRDATAVTNAAKERSMKIGMDICPGTTGALERQCLIASWGTTTPTFGSEDTACATATGTYNKGSQCFIMEAY